MNILRLTALGTLALTLHLQAQTPVPAPPPPPASGPTLEQTIAFIDGMMRQHGRFSVDYPPPYQGSDRVVESQSLQSTDKCKCEYESTFTSDKHHISIQKLLLDSEDPRAVSVELANHRSTSPIWSVRLRVEDNQGLYVDGKQFHWDIEELREENKHMDLGDFLSKDLAERVAKAYIHALVLCHKSEAPSPF